MQMFRKASEKFGISDKSLDMFGKPMEILGIFGIWSDVCSPFITEKTRNLLKKTLHLHWLSYFS